MPVILHSPNGKWEFETVEAAVEFEMLRDLRRLGPVPATPEKLNSVETERVNKIADSVGFIDSLNENQLAIVRCLVLNDGKMTTGDVAGGAGVEPGQVGGFVRHIRDRGGDFGFDREQVIVSTKRPKRPGQPQVSQFEVPEATKKQLRRHFS